jgi:hypothetical protein
MVTWLPDKSIPYMYGHKLNHWMGGDSELPYMYGISLLQYQNL